MAREKYIVDTNVFLRYVLADNVNQYKLVKNFFGKASKRKIDLILVAQVVFEMEYVLRILYKKEKREIVDMFKSILSWEWLIIREGGEILKRTISLFKDTNVSLVDCYLSVVAKNEKAEVFSFDNRPPHSIKVKPERVGADKV